MNREQLSYNVKYTSLHGTYQAALVLTMGYSSIYLMYLGLSESMVGIVLAIANLLAAVMQPILGTYLDKRKHISVPWFSIGILGITMLLSLISFFIQRNTWPTAVCFILIFALLAAIQPMLNSISFMLEQRGIHINFGLSRGLGSICYAIFSALLGTILVHISTSFLPIIYIIIFGLQLIAYLTVRKLKRTDAIDTTSMESQGKTSTNQESEQALPLGLFMKTYRRYIVFLAGCLLIFIFLYASGNFFTIYIVENIGGGTKEMGLAVAIAAAVELPAMALSTILIKKIPLHWLLRITGLFFLVKFFLLMSAPSIPVFYVAQLFQFLSFGMFFPVAIAYTGRLLPKADLVKGQSLFTTMMSAGGILSSLAGGLLLGYTSVNFTLYLLFAVAVVGVVIMCLAVQKTRN